MWNWFSKHAQAFGALFSALALVGVLYQVSASERAQREQSARDIYREFVALTINKPELATMKWSADLPDKDKASYEAYVEYLLYTSEQVINVDQEWTGPMRGWLEDHVVFLCQLTDTSNYTAEVQTLIDSIKASNCGGDAQ
jgi:hypothetical protein